MLRFVWIHEMAYECCRLKSSTAQHIIHPTPYIPLYTIHFTSKLLARKSFMGQNLSRFRDTKRDIY